MAVSASKFKSTFSEFASLDDATVNEFLAYAKDYLNTKLWGSKYDYALMLQTAHLLSLSSSSSSMTSGVVSSERIGPASISYATSSSSTSPSSTSKYGTRLNELMQTLVISPLIM